MGKQKRIGIGGSAANPPHLAHQYLVQAILESKRFDMFFWIVSGLRSDKNILVESSHRVAMNLLTFPDDWRGLYPNSFSIISLYALLLVITVILESQNVSSIFLKLLLFLWIKSRLKA